MGDKNLYLVTNKLIYNIHFSVRNERKKFRTMLKFIYRYLFFYDELKRLNEIDVSFWQLVWQTYSYPFLFTNLHFSLKKKKFQRSFTLVLIIFLQTNPKMLDANRMISKSILLVLFSCHLEARINKSSISFRGTRRKFLDIISVRKTIWDLEFSEHLLKNFLLACLS